MKHKNYRDFLEKILKISDRSLHRVKKTGEREPDINISKSLFHPFSGFSISTRERRRHHRQRENKRGRARRRKRVKTGEREKHESRNDTRTHREGGGGGGRRERGEKRKESVKRKSKRERETVFRRDYYSWSIPSYRSFHICFRRWTSISPSNGRSYTMGFIVPSFETWSAIPR